MEEPLPAGGSCLLGSINLSAFVGNDRTFNFPDFIKTVHIAVRALNKVLIDGLPLHPLKIQQESVHNWRQIGLGVMGIADMLIKMGIKYVKLQLIYQPAMLLMNPQRWQIHWKGHILNLIQKQY